MLNSFPRLVCAAIGLVVTSFLLGACLAHAEDAATDPFPLTVGDEWTYQIGNEQGPVPGAEMTLKVAKQESSAKGEAPWVRVDTFALGKAAPEQMESYSVEGGVVLKHRVAVPGASVDVVPALPQLSLPLAEGRQWSWEGKFGDEKAVGKMTVEAVEEVEVPAGKFKAFRVRYEFETSGGGKETSYKWFAPGVGMVMQDDPVRTDKGAIGHRIGKLKAYKLAGK